MSDELPAAAVEAGQRGLEACEWHTTEIMARAVLVAATERIECPNADCVNGRIPPNSWDHGDAKDCWVCAGSGFLYVLK